MKIIPLSEGEFTIDKTKVFVPFKPDSDDLQARPTGSLLVEVQPFVVITEKDVLLLDAGLGFMQGNELQLHANMRAKGIDPNSITKVLMSHLHKDHAGGVCIKDRFGDYSLAFPKATYYVQQQELEYALEGSSPSYLPEEVRELSHADNVVLQQGNGAIGDNYIRYEITGAHSKYHQVYWIQEGEEIIFFGGDDAPQFTHMKNRFVAKYDYDGKKCMELRQQWKEEGTQGHWTFLFYHDIKYPFQRF